MKRSRMRWLSGWLALCLLIGMVYVGVAEEVTIDASTEKVELDGLSIEIDNNLDEASALEELPDDTTGLILDADIGPVQTDSFDGVTDLTLGNDGIALEAGETENSDLRQPNDSDSEDFEIDEEGILVSYKGEGGDVVIPDGVTGIDAEAFFRCESLTSVTIPDSVEEIFYYDEGDDDYYDDGPDDYYGDDDYGDDDYESDYGSSYLNGEYIGAFAYCNNLKKINFGKGLEDIGGCAFLGCTSLTSVYIPDGVTTIGERAFQNCSNLTRVDIPDSVTFIMEHSFGACDNLEQICVSEENNSYTSKDGILYTANMEGLIQCPGAKSGCVTIPDGVTYIEDGAFKGCGRLERVDIPDKTTRIGKQAFQNCYELERVTIPYSVINIMYDAFFTDDGSNLSDLTIYGYEGSYAESYAQEMDFPFIALEGKMSIEAADVTIASQVYTGKRLKPAVEVVLYDKTLKKGTDYTVSYENNKEVGTATAIVNGKGNYTGKVQATFKINPKPVAFFQIMAGKKMLIASWLKVAGISGYQLQYGLKKNFKSSKKVTVSNASTVKKTLKSLKKGKTYYVRIRTYKKVNGITYWSNWSDAKKAKVL